MFNLLMSGDDEAWKDGRSTIDRSRFLEYTDIDLKIEFKDLSVAACDKLTHIPTLFAYERVRKKAARLGRITAIKPMDKRIDIHYLLYPEMEISARHLEEHLIVLDIDSKFEMNRTHWAVKNRDIFEVGLFRKRKPEIELSRRVFVVHGHDDELKDEVSALLRNVGLEPIVLRLEPDKGRTVIEKFEQLSDVGFAVVLITPDDPMQNGAMRARQNVILELGYFVGRLGRHRVCSLKKGHLEVPSDIVGVLSKNVDKRGKWREELKTELTAAGYELQIA